MSTATGHDDKDAREVHPKDHHRDDYQHLETLDQLGLIHDKDDHLTPIDTLFNTKECSPKPSREPREVL
jgi:hypothetical protein